MADWQAHGTCPVCAAGRGRPCVTRLAAGPQALPTLYADAPHSSRRRGGATAAKTKTPEAAAKTPAKAPAKAPTAARTPPVWLRLPASRVDA